MKYIVEYGDFFYKGIEFFESLSEALEFANSLDHEYCYVICANNNDVIEV